MSPFYNLEKFKLVEENKNLNIFEYLDFFEKYFFRDEDNSGLMNYLFSKEEASKLLEDYYQVIKNDKQLLEKLHNYSWKLMYKM